MTNTVHQVGVTLIVRKNGVQSVLGFFQNRKSRQIIPKLCDCTSLAYAFADILILTGLAAHAPAQAGRALLGSAEKSHTQKGPDLCGNTTS